MSSLNRSIKRRNEVKKKKALKKGLKKVLNATAGIPSNCTTCNKKFDKEEDPSKWFMTIRDTGITLSCEKCAPEKST